MYDERAVLEMESVALLEIGRDYGGEGEAI